VKALACTAIDRPSVKGRKTISGGVVDAGRVDDRVGERPAAGIGNCDLQFCRVGDG